MSSRPYLVFADVDETLIRCKSMFDFLRHWLTTQQGSAGEAAYDDVRAGLQRAADSGVRREEINRAYYAHYRGASVTEVAAAGRRWYAERATQGLFIDGTREALRAHRAAGAEIVLVSGSFPACLRPVAAAVEAARLLCTRPETEDGRYTGRVPVPMIGTAKADAVRAVLSGRPDIAPGDCYAYGDHPSDLPMLDCVGHPVAVGDDPAVRAHLAARRTHPPLELQR